MNPPWPLNPHAREKVPPDVDWLIGCLTNINHTCRPDETIVRHAFGIYYHLTNHRLRGRQTYNLNGSIKKGFRVTSRSAHRGLSHELARLERAARSGSMARWIRAWAAVSPRCRELVWHPTPPPIIKRELNERGRLISFRRAAIQHKLVGIDGVLIGPRPTDVLEGIVRVRRNLAAIPPNDRRGNKLDETADAFAASIRSAVLDLTDRVGVTRDPITDSYSGPLIELGAAIDDRFGTRICWRLIATK